MSSNIVTLILSFSLAVLHQWTTGIPCDTGLGKQFDGYPSIQDQIIKQKEGSAWHPEYVTTSENSLSDSEKWNLKINGFSPAYYDKVRDAIAINTVEQPTDKWAAATTSFELLTGIYTIRFTSLLESDGESSYKVRIDDKQVLEFQNPRIYGKDIPEYAPHVVEVKDVAMVRGCKIQVEFLPHSNGLVPEGDGFGYARARWSNNIEFLPQ
ncbi:MAG: hypothetical protein JJU34_15360 [Lunatimonas sp.]|uniref:hypothetical protein n=1 Tax=Lunatimonas sp. TaxID=2060141 RepID=UPI00263B58BB|nr:hypothetical protein [Lunatimonas sp.]MCC5938658.1 hypothetical protein [Lunatimonas sp.]